MAIDTRAKRVSLLSRGMPWCGASCVVPTGGIEVGDRKALLGLYAFGATSSGGGGGGGGAGADMRPNSLAIAIGLGVGL